MPKSVASTLKSVLDHPVMQVVLDRSKPSKPAIAEVDPWWAYDLYTRNPGPAVTEDGEIKTTDLDLACFLYALSQRGAVINIPTYTGRRASQKREGERVVSKENRHGQITGLTANKECFSFGLRIQDFNVIQQDLKTGAESVGAPRAFMVVDVTGDFYDGWKTIEFTPSARENKFLADKKLWTDNKVVFKNFVHPNRWISMYGSYYFLTKALLVRLEDEAKFCADEIKRILAAGINYPPAEAPREWPHSEKVGVDKPIKVSALEVELALPAPTGTFTPYPTTQAGLVDATQWRKSLVYGISPRLRFATRTVELAFFREGFTSVDPSHPVPTPHPNAAEAALTGNKDYIEKFPPWVSGAAWERNYVPPGRRSKFNRLVLFQEQPGQLGISLLYRVWEKTERVAVD